jgi:hypothetical protein
MAIQNDAIVSQSVDVGSRDLVRTMETHVIPALQGYSVEHNLNNTGVHIFPKIQRHCDLRNMYYLYISSESFIFPLTIQNVTYYFTWV